MLDAWAQPSSATPVHAPVSSSSPPTTGCSPTRSAEGWVRNPDYLTAAQGAKRVGFQRVRRCLNTLVLVHRTELLKQWQERLWAFLDVGKEVVSTIGGGKSRPTGRIDIAVVQSLSRQGEVNPLVEEHVQVTVDECHYVGAVSFDAILKRTRAKYMDGLTATPIRRDGQQPIIFMQCWPIRHTAAKPAGAPQDLEVVPRSRIARIDLPSEAGIQLESWSVRISTIPLSIPWYWRCRFPGSERCSSTPAACTGSTHPRPGFRSSISSTPATRHCSECGTSASAGPGRWVTGSLRKWSIHEPVFATFRRRLHRSEMAERGPSSAVNQPPPFTIQQHPVPAKSQPDRWLFWKLFNLSY